MQSQLSKMPNCSDLVEPVYEAIKILGGSGTNTEIYDKVCELLNVDDGIKSESHLGSTTTTELFYRVAWAKTKLKKEGRIINSERSVWSICDNISERTDAEKKVDELFNNQDDEPEDCEKWREQLSKLLHEMDPFMFEKLIQRLLRECGFESVNVTKKTGDGGIDGEGKLKVNGIFSFNVAFQCKRYSGSVGAPEIRDFRGSLSTSMEKGVLITTGTFTPLAIKEASDPGKKQIDLINGDELITKMKDLKLGLREIKSYEVDRSFFESLAK